MNYPMLLLQLKSDVVFKISDRLKAYQVQPLKTKKIIVKQYQCKKYIKTNITTKKSQQYHLTTIEDELFSFFEIKQVGSIKPSVYTLAEKQFLEGNMLDSILQEINEKTQTEYQITGYKWDGFTIQFLSFSEDMFLLIITNQMISSIIRTFSTKDVQFKIKQGFEQIVARIINQKKANEWLQNYGEELKKMFEKHQQLTTEVHEGRQINFNLIRYAKISDISAQEVKLKLEIQKRESSSMKMEIQK